MTQYTPKKIDLEKELDSFAYTLPHSATSVGPCDKKFDDPRKIEAREHGWRHSWSYESVLEIAKHFFELGAKTWSALDPVQSLLDSLEAKDVDLDKEAEWIANGIMIAVQSAKLHTNIYNPDRKDYDRSHLMQAARRGIELGMRINKGE